MSNNKMPSMVALLGLLAVAGYQHRDKIGDMIRDNSGAGGTDGNKDRSAGSSPASFLKEISSIFGGSGGGGSLSEAVDGILDKFRGTGQAQSAESWVSSGSNQNVHPNDLAASLGENVVQELVLKTGLARAEILTRLAQRLPEAVDHMTPSGRVPSAEEAQAFI